MNSGFRDRLSAGEIVQSSAFSGIISPRLDGRMVRPRDEVTSYAGRVYETTQEENHDLLRMLSEVCGTPVDPVTFKARLRASHTQDGFTLSFVHIDNFDVVCIVYMVPLPPGELPDEFGTRFYLHVPTASKRVDRSRKLNLVKAGIILTQSLQPECWQEWKRVPWQEGMAVLFDGGFYHSSSDRFFGNDDQSGRITLELFGNFKG